MVYEFEGRTEKEAIDNAAEQLGLEKDDFDVEIVEAHRQGLFKKGHVRIRVHTDKPVATMSASATATMSKSDAADGDSESDDSESGGKARRAPVARAFGDPEARNEFEEKVSGFVAGIIERMGYDGKVTVLFREENKLGLKMDSEHSSILIGKKGKNIDAIQLLANVYARQLGRDDMRIILDSENYRIRREESLVRLAYSVADRVGENRSSVLLEPMNPFDRRLIHTTLNDIAHVETKSEGEGLYKRVRVSFRGAGGARSYAGNGAE
jgi:spoIIIJ-associated protein